MLMDKNTALADLPLQSIATMSGNRQTLAEKSKAFGSDILFPAYVPLLRVPGAPLNLFYVRKVMLGFIYIKKRIILFNW